MSIKSTPFGPDRARELWEGRGPCCKIHITPGEDAYVRQIWATLPGDTSWMTAFFQILNGQVLPFSSELLKARRHEK